MNSLAAQFQAPEAEGRFYQLLVRVSECWETLYFRFKYMFITFSFLASQLLGMGIFCPRSEVGEHESLRDSELNK